MAGPKIIVIGGSLRTGSYSTRLAALAVKELLLADVEVNRVSFEDYEMPIYDANLENKSGPPAAAVKLKQQFMAHHGVFIATPEYNASVPPLLKNGIDWVSRVRERGDPPYAAFKNRPFALGSTSPGRFGGARALIALRQILELGCGALVLPDQVSVAHAETAFNDKDELAEQPAANALRSTLQKLVEMARLMM
ncbi:MAG: NAD(P)H-dependent oxidoreductase [Pseudolabrys sp.]|nr:NAD(P)H-dependent oxidoreductase [Pseudolabrys sp.]MBV9956326.1 NAD(P)H-dependent oxidoreductase [Pseudolabrys sp.]